MLSVRLNGFIIAAIAGLVVAASPLLPAADGTPGAKPKKADSLVDTPEAALRKFTVAPGLKVDLFAAEPDVRNPVALSIDELGRVFVVESDRRRSSVFDIRGHKDWLEADFSFRTVQERAGFLKQQVSPTNLAVIKRLTGGGRGNFGDFNQDGIIDWRDLEVQSERIRLLEDTDGDGRADRVSVFADGFTNMVAGVAAGVLARRGEVYFTCIPDLWKLRSDGTTPARALTADLRPLLSGFGVHIAFGGHDMHGLIFGPDGKLYWSIADRGTDTNLFAKIKNPWPGLTPELLADSGCIFRANTDGSDFEVFACGLRNPQELAFDEYGNLFTADNNGDGGDKARWHYVVEGADFGWRLGWQWLEARAYQPKMGPWNGERLWHLAESNTAAYLLPPLAHIGHGPAGLAYNPGTGLPAQFDRHFFLCDFPGHVLMWTNIPDGASFKVGPVKNFFGELGPSDVAFGVDGGVYVTDWFKSFDKSDKGRIYRIHDPETDKSAVVQETKRLLAEGTAKRSLKELGELLGHADMRVRLEAQWELVARGEWQMLCNAASVAGTPARARFQALAAADALLRKTPSSNDDSYLAKLTALIPALHQSEPEMTAQAIRVLWNDPDSEIRIENRIQSRGWPSLVNYLSHPHLRVRVAALEWLGKCRQIQTTTLVLEVLNSNQDRDLYLRHAAVLALARMCDSTTLVRVLGTNGTKWPWPPSATAGESTPFSAPRPVRLGVLLALRRLGSPEVVRFLSDSDTQIVLEAARAINDVPIPAAYPQLAALVAPDVRRGTNRILTSAATEIEFFTLRRALNANFRLGHPTNAFALAAFAARPDAPEPLRIESLELLADWPKPPARDHFMGLYRPLPPRDGMPAADALRPVLALLLRDAPKEVKLAATRAATALGVQEADLFALLSDASQSPEVRVEALKSLASQNDARLSEALKLARNDKSEILRIEAGRLQGASSEAVEQWAGVLERGTLAEKQAVLASIAAAQPSDANTQLRGRLDKIMSRQLDALLSGKLAPELQLDVLDAAEKLKSWNLAGKLAQYESSLAKAEPLAAYRPTLLGGNAENGKKLFIENQQIACFRCHKINGEGGEVGPDLTGIGAQKGRDYLLESIVHPNKQVAAGFENVLVTLKNGVSHAGLVKSESATELVLNVPDEGLLTLKKSDLQSRNRGLSAMPEELATFLTRRELRDIIEFLATAK